MKVRTVAIAILFFSSVLSGCAGNDSEKDDRIEALESELSDSISDHDSSLEQITTLELSLIHISEPTRQEAIAYAGLGV